MGGFFIEICHCLFQLPLSPNSSYLWRFTLYIYRFTFYICFFKFIP